MVTSRTVSSSSRKSRDLRKRILESRPGVRALWDASEQKRLIALTLVHLRKRAGLTQADLAARAGWDKSYVSRLESAGDSVPDTATILRYGKACQTVVTLVFTDPELSRVHVIDAVTLQAPGNQRPFDSLRDQDLVVAEAPATSRR